MTPDAALFMPISQKCNSETVLMSSYVIGRVGGSERGRNVFIVIYFSSTYESALGGRVVTVYVWTW